jgi:hypothetical protein
MMTLFRSFSWADGVDAISIVLVLIGVWCGLKAHVNRFKNPHDKTGLLHKYFATEFLKSKWEYRNEQLEIRWEWVVVFGIALELFALGLHIRNAVESDERIAGLEREAQQFRLKADELEKEMMETTNNVAKIDPMNRPIRKMSAHVILEAMCPDIPVNINPPPWFFRHRAELEFRRPHVAPPVGYLGTDTITASMEDRTHWRCEFEFHDLPFEDPLLLESVPVGEWLTNVTSASIWQHFIPTNA